MYEEPRLREQDFGNYQPNSAEMTRMWQERASYGHFFYRISNGESAADAYDRVAGFNESLWRSFGERDFASVCLLVTHGLMTRVFLMKWYHWSVEYFEDLRNVNHCEFVVMARSPESGKYVLRNQMRTWSQYRRDLLEERRESASSAGQNAGGPLMTPVAAAAAAAASAPLATPAPKETSPVPFRQPWSNRKDSIGRYNAPLKPRRQNTEDLFRSDDEDAAPSRPRAAQLPAQRSDALGRATRDHPPDKVAADVQIASTAPVLEDDSDGNDKLATEPSRQQIDRRLSLKNAHNLPADMVMMLSAGRDGGGSRSGNCSSNPSSESDDGPHFGPHYTVNPGDGGDEDEADDEDSGEHGHTWLAESKNDDRNRSKGGLPVSAGQTKPGGSKKAKAGAPKSMALALTGALEENGKLQLGHMADALGDQSPDEAELDGEIERLTEKERSFDASVR